MAGIPGEYIYNEAGEIIGATGGKKTTMTNKAKYGEDFYKTLGAQGGKAKGVAKGFASEKLDSNGLTGRQRAEIHGARGGRKSRKSRKNHDSN